MKKFEIQIATALMVISIGAALLYYYKYCNPRIHLEAMSIYAIILRSENSDTIELHEVIINDSLKIYGKTTINDDSLRYTIPNHFCKEHLERIMDDTRFQEAQTIYYHDIQLQIAPKKKSSIDIATLFNQSCKTFTSVNVKKIKIITSNGNIEFAPRIKESLFTFNGITYYDLNKRSENSEHFYLIER